MQSRYVDFTSGSIHSSILRFTIPLILSNLLQSLYNAVDMVFVGKFASTAALSAVSSSGSVINIMIMTISGFCVGISVALGMRCGRHDSQQVIRQCCGTAVTLIMIAAIITTVAGFLLTPTLVRMVCTPADAVEDAIAYLYIIFAGILFMFGYNLNHAFFRGYGKSGISLLLVAISSVVNGILDYILIAHFHMGATGAAIATVFSQGVSFLSGAAYLGRRGDFPIYSSQTLCLKKQEVHILLQVGLPAALQQLLINISGTTLNGLANTYGMTASAAYGVAMKIDTFSMLPHSAVGEAVATFSSQNIGAKKPERALGGLRWAILLCCVMLSLMFAVVQIFCREICGVFSNQQDVIDTAFFFVRVYSFSYFSFILVSPLMGFVRGTGNSIFTMISVIVAQYCIRIPLAFFFTKVLSMGIQGIAVASIISPYSAMLIYGYAVVSGRWRKSREAVRLARLQEDSVPRSQNYSRED